MKIVRLFGNLLRRRQVEDSLDAELRAYVDELTDRNVATGMPREEARRQARMQSGGIEQIKEEVREVWLDRQSRLRFVTRAIQALLCGVPPLDRMTMTGVVGLVGIVALAAATAPAWRASRIAPQTSLRAE